MEKRAFIAVVLDWISSWREKMMRGLEGMFISGVNIRKVKLYLIKSRICDTFFSLLAVSTCFYSFVFCSLFQSNVSMFSLPITLPPPLHSSSRPLTFQWDLCPRGLAVGHFPGDHFTLHHTRPHQDRHEAAGVFHSAVRYQQAGALHVGPWPLPAPQNPCHQRGERNCRALWARRLSIVLGDIINAWKLTNSKRLRQSCYLQEVKWFVILMSFIYGRLFQTADMVYSSSWA